MSNIYSDNQQFVTAITNWGQLVFELLILQQQLSQSDDFVTKDNVEPKHLLQQIRSQSSVHISMAIEAKLDELNEFESLLEQSLTACFDKQVFIPFVHIRRLFGLSIAEQQLLLLALLPEISEQFAIMLVALHDRYQLSSSGFEWHHKLLQVFISCRQYPKDSLNQCFFESSPLVYWHLLRAKPLEGGQLHCYCLDPIVRDYLLGVAAPQLHFIQSLSLLSVTDTPSFVAKENQQQLASLAAHYAQPDERSLVINLQGADSLQLKQVAANWLEQFSMQLAVLDSKAIAQRYQQLNQDSQALLSHLRRMLRDALLCNFCLLLENTQMIAAKDEITDVLATVLNEIISNFRFVVIVNGAPGYLSDWAFAQSHAVTAVNLFIHNPDLAARLKIWQYYAKQLQLPFADEQYQQLSVSYLLDQSQILQSIQRYHSRMLIEKDSPWEMMLESCRSQTERDLNNIARLVRSRFKFNDIVLPQWVKEQLQDVLNYAKYRHQVIEQWGFDQNSAHSKNLCALFYGPSGTGKTMAASVIANELNQSLYRIDLSSVMSKYIGETEKNLAQLFDQAEAMNVVLFFDEAESLFGKRTESKDSHDRYANLQTSYLLQRIEHYQGVVILSTNLLKNIDSAFIRRFKFIIEYPFPSTAQRSQLWRSAFSKDVPLASDIDLELMAQRVPFTGGSINNIAIKAAFLAAAEQQPLGMTQLLRATEQEYHKQGKVFVAEEFSWENEDDLW